MLFSKTRFSKTIIIEKKIENNFIYEE